MNEDRIANDRGEIPTGARQLTVLQVGDSPGAWRGAGFEVDAAGLLQLGSTILRCADSGGGFEGWTFAGLQPGGTYSPEDALDGLAFLDPTEPLRTSSSQHPNGIHSIDHVVVRTGDCARTAVAFTDAGFEVRGGRSTTSYGSPMRQTFFWAGDVILELVGPDAGEPTTDEPTSVFGLALVSADLDSTATALGDLLGTPKDAVQPGRQIAGLRNRSVGISLPIAVMSPHVRS